MVQRRSFVKLCASLAAAVSARPGVLAQEQGAVRHFNRVKLVDADGRAVSPAALAVGENYVFHYPYVSTPCFLLSVGRPVPGGQILETESGRPYEWRGGVGPDQSVVAFSAICSHKMTHPSPSVSFINYRHEATAFEASDGERARRAHIIYCCSEKSVYDVTRGCRVLGGPAPQPLAAVLLEYDPQERALHAAGTYGGELFEPFFEKFRERLQLEYLITDVRERVSGSSTVEPLEEFSRRRVLC